RLPGSGWEWGAVSQAQHLTPATQPTVGADFARIYTAYPLGRPPGLPGIQGPLAFLSEDTLLVGGFAASSSGALYKAKVLRRPDTHIIGFDNDANPRTPYEVEYFTDAPFNDSGLVITPEGLILANQWPPPGVNQLRISGGTPYQTLPEGLGGLAFVPPDLPGAELLKAVSIWRGNSFFTLNTSIAGTFEDGKPRLQIDSQDFETTVSREPGAIAYVPLNAPEFDGVPY
ncbi:MAG: hypothetical protein HC921_20795, partial [Synechococcaceae cyanobacterium SM2_3_1]|nr:hypothetical protein [Synechococcaceae cyanobacterium SM2_3_1]